MHFTLGMSALALALLVAMLMLLELGRRLGARRQAQLAGAPHAGLAGFESMIFALLGLLIAFTFSGAATRFDARRQLVAQEANDIGTAFRRLDLLGADAQRDLRERFRTYVDARIALFRASTEAERAEQHVLSTRLQGEIWERAVADVRASEYTPAAMLLLPALNAMIDITTTRLVATWTHPPATIFAMLFGLALAAALLAGYAMAQGRARSWTHMLCFAGVIAAVVFVILDMEYPRRGLIRVDAVDQVLFDLRRSMQ